jgi:hypothetical protein
MLLAFAGAAFATPLEVTVTFQGSLTGVDDGNGNYVTPYIVAIDDGTTSTPVIQLVTCYDNIDPVGPGQSWQAYEYTLSDAVSQGMFSGFADAELGYKKIGWLSAQTYSTPEEEVALQYAVWDVFGTTPALSGGRLTAYNAYETALATQVTNDFAGFDFAGTRFLEQVGGVVGASGTHQAFVFAITTTDGHQSSTPEPGTLVMLGSGALCLLASLRFKRTAVKRG